jgi:hypothetical protein
MAFESRDSAEHRAIRDYYQRARDKVARRQLQIAAVLREIEARENLIEVLRASAEVDRETGEDTGSLDELERVLDRQRIARRWLRRIKDLQHREGYVGD